MDEVFSKVLTALANQSPIGVFVMTAIAGIYTMIRSLRDRNSRAMENSSQPPPWVLEKAMDELRRVSHSLERQTDLLREIKQLLEVIRNEGLFRSDRPR